MRGGWLMRRTMFVVYLVLVFGGLAYFLAVGLLHM
jgi:hypothetical protein